MTNEHETPDAELQARLARLSPERRALLERALAQRDNSASADGTTLGAAAPERIHARPRGAPVPLTPAQELLWNLDQAVSGVVAYNVPRVLRLVGEVQVPLLQKALDALVARHEALRTRFSLENGTPQQIVDAPRAVSLELVDLRTTDAASRTATTRAEIVQRTRRHFNLSADLLLRATLVQVDDDEFVLLLLTHHIVCDERSRDVTFRELGELYNALIEGRTPELPPLAIQFGDYAIWQRAAMEDGALAPQLAYWRTQLAGMETLEVPTDRPRGALPAFEGARRRYTLPRELLNAARELSRREGVTLNMTLLAVYAVVLGRHSGQSDVVIGSPVSSRSQVALEGLIGFFPNTIVLRTRPAADSTFRELLLHTRETCLAAYEHQDVPLEKLAIELRNSGQLGHSPLFNVWFVMLGDEPTTLELTGAVAIPEAIDFATAKFDILMGAREHAGGLDIVLEYRTALFDGETIDRFAEHFETALRAAVEDANCRVGELPLLSERERALVVHEWNATQTSMPADATLVSLLSEQVTRTPAAVALVDEAISLTYAALDAASTRLAESLHAAGATAGSLVGVCAVRSAEMVVALIAVLKAGAAYVPLDPEYPADRLQFMIEDANVQVLLTQQDLVNSLPGIRGAQSPILLLDGCAGALTTDSVKESEPLSLPRAEDPAYMIYTSGSTGRPKGALNAHRGIVNRLLWMQSEYALRADDVVLQKTPFSFDVSVWEFFWPLMTGATLVMARPGGHRDTGYLADVITRHGVTVCHFVPSMLRAFLADVSATQCDTLRDVMASGEALSPDLVAGFYSVLPHARLHNLYGPTECAVDVTYWPCPPATEAPAVVPIGRPVANTQVYVLEPSGLPAPVGVPGELFLGGVQVGLGYHNRPELTAERFVIAPVPLARAAGERLYRTGDRARWRADGTIEYLGRLDFQVKVRGFRIELGEIETTLAQNPDVRDVCVAAHDDGGDARLVAYIVPQETDTAATATEAVERWSEVFDRTYSHADETGDAVESGFNIAGWLSSYNKQPIPAAEMREWVDRTCDRILELRPQRILEIGCGTGLLLFRLAPHVTRYHGLDIAATALASIQSDPAFAAIANRVTLAESRADEIGVLQAGSFDVVVINSVAQYFPSAEYLVGVLEEACRLVGDHGAVFVGDVRLRPLLEVLNTSVALHDAADDQSITDLRARVQQRMWHESELVIDPEFFDALRGHVPRISDVRVLIKRGAARNELTRFRGDVVLYVGDTATTSAEGARNAGDVAEISALLQARPEVLRLADLPDARIARDITAHNLLATAPAQGSVRDLNLAIAANSPRGIDPEVLATLDAEYAVQLSWPRSGTPGRFDAEFVRRDVKPQVGRSTGATTTRTQASAVRPWPDYVHHAAPEAFTLDQVTRLRAHLAAVLPDYMVPSTFVRLDALPLTPSGKVDRKALRPPGIDRPRRAHVAPSTPTEQAIAAIWSDVLRIEEVGTDDGFLDLGGHSLLAIRVAGRVRRELGVVLPLDTLIRGETVAQVARRIDALRVAQPVAEEDDFSLIPVSRETFRRSAAPSAHEA